MPAETLRGVARSIMDAPAGKLAGANYTQYRVHTMCFKTPTGLVLVSLLPGKYNLRIIITSGQCASNFAITVTWEDLLFFPNQERPLKEIANLRGDWSAT